MSDQQQKIKRPWRARVVTLVLVVVVVTTCLVVGLKNGGYGKSIEIATQQMVGGKPRYCANVQLGARLSSTQSRSELSPFAFDEVKDARTFRIFILGGSAAQGYPEEVFDFGRMLELMLDDAYAGADFEVINLGLAGARSEFVAQIAESCVNFEPDLMIVYTGHNEAGASDVEGAERAAMQFAKNLHGICRAGTDAGAHVLLCSLPCHPRDLLPSAVRHRSDLAELNGVVKSVAAELRGEAVSFVDLAKVFQDRPASSIGGAELFYDLIHPQFSGKHLIARALFDVTSVLLPEGISRHKADGSDWSLVACETRLVYTDLERYLSTRRVIEMMRGSTFLNESYPPERIVELQNKADAFKQAMEPKMNDLLGRYKRMTGQHPDDWRLGWKIADYANRYYKNPRLAQAQAEKVLQSVPHTQARILLMRLAIAQGRLSDGEAHAKALITLYPDRADHYFDLGEIYKFRGEYEEGIDAFEKGIKLNPGNQSVVAYTYLAELHEALGRPGKAIDTLYDALADDPAERAARVYSNLGILLADQNRQDEAVKVLTQALDKISAKEFHRRDEVRALLEELGEMGLAKRLTEPDLP